MADYKPTVRTVLNRERLQELDGALAKGLELLAMQVISSANPPDAPPYGQGLVANGRFISYVDGKRVGGDADKKPKAMKVRGRGIVVGIGYPFPSKFQEMGTVKQPPRPFLTPAVMAVVGNRGLVEGAVKTAVSTYLSKKAAKIARRAKYGPGKPSGRPLDFGNFISAKAFVR